MKEHELFSAMGAFAHVNKLGTMERVLKNIQDSDEHLSEDLIGRIGDAVRDDLKSFIAEKEAVVGRSECGMEYLGILRKSLIEDDMLATILGMDLKADCGPKALEEADPRKYEFRDYNCMLWSLCHALIFGKRFEQTPFEFSLSLALVLDIFSKKTVPGMEDMTIKERERKIGEKYSAVDHHFHFQMLEGEQKMVLFHLKNAIVHGSIALSGS